MWTAIPTTPIRQSRTPDRSYDLVRSRHVQARPRHSTSYGLSPGGSFARWSGTEFDVQSVLSFGTVVTILGREGNWALVDATGDGSASGFAYSSYLRKV